MPELTHLGGMFSDSGSNIAERRERLLAINRVWNQLSGFWHSDAGWKPKRLLFGGCVHSAATPG
eukprot:1106068-Pyramimonas_sp.AAC.1